MNIVVDSRKARERKRRNWRRWFAWHPVWIKSHTSDKTIIVWLNFVERRGELEPIGPYGSLEWKYEYRLI